ncbi:MULTISPECIES: LysR family transcriptional regulator [unclassified Bradyrhizobium]|uniref:LysR family transcriptional regulator n=1 Tax=unclassified Bradyrhizobium TaxID=2631580 RepID=UPI00247A2E8D|nr:MULTISPECIES: LysR family transcriptional regulator [unclassified Bradyrhizobium]WGR70035.1 LysR family transcriptional regulator [Bradyrhizobium sp. ISRA426]WGR82092.1 LysR family transcriptional regulator [Bradyrhizobium sp. ISRA430]WGR85278.1 LysR family transcriptional regulator [Bradyrhizobium sp. ISRA432]
MDLIWLEDFLAIAEEGGFSRAAERRHVTQPALSRRIRSLEEWLGTPLFERSTHTITLTAAGESFRPVAEDVLRRVLVGREEALEVARLKAETITFAATHALSQTFFPEWIRSSDSARAGSAVQLVASNFAGCEKLLLDAQAHFLLAHYHPSLVSRLDMDRFLRIELSTDMLIPISAPMTKPGRGGRRSKAKPRYALPGASGAPLPYLAYHPGSGVGRLVTSFLAAKDPAAWLVPSFAAPVMLLIDMAREGRGVTWAPMGLVGADLDSGRLLRAGGAEWEIPIGISLFRPRARMTRAAENFWNVVRKGRPAGKAAAAPRTR